MSISFEFDGATDFNNVLIADILAIRTTTTMGTFDFGPPSPSFSGAPNELFSFTNGVLSLTLGGSGPFGIIFADNASTSASFQITTGLSGLADIRIQYDANYVIGAEGNGGETRILGVRSVASEVPEPSTLAIFALGMIGLASCRFMKQS